MNLERFLAERADGWAELKDLVDRAGVRGAKLSPTEVHRLGALYRVAAADLATARQQFPRAVGTERLQSLVASANALVYGRRTRGSSLRQFLVTDLWRGVRSLGAGPIGLAVGLTVGFTLLGALWARVDPQAAAGIVPFAINTHAGNHGKAGLPIAARPGLATSIFTNNIEVSFEALAGGFTLGLLSGYLVAYNSAMLGVLGMLEWRGHNFSQFVRLIVPHGVLELSCIAIAAATGFRIAASLVAPGLRSRAQALAALVPAVGDAILAVCLALVVAGLTEGIVTTWNLPMGVAITYGCTLAALFWAGVLWRGRPEAVGAADRIGAGALRPLPGPALISGPPA